MSSLYVPGAVAGTRLRSSTWSCFRGAHSLKQYQEPLRIPRQQILLINHSALSGQAPGCLSMFLNMPLMRMLPSGQEPKMKLIGHPHANETTLNHWWFPQNTMVLVHIILFLSLSPAPPPPLGMSKSTRNVQINSSVAHTLYLEVSLLTSLSKIFSF